MHLLKDSLEGNSVMIACFSNSFDDTLKYVNRTQNIKTRIERNVHNVSFHIHKYIEIISSARGNRGTVSVPDPHNTRSQNGDS